MSSLILIVPFLWTGNSAFFFFFETPSGSCCPVIRHPSLFLFRGILLQFHRSSPSSPTFFSCCLALSSYLSHLINQSQSKTEHWRRTRIYLNGSEGCAWCNEEATPRSEIYWVFSEVSTRAPHSRFISVPRCFAPRQSNTPCWLVWVTRSLSKVSVCTHLDTALSLTNRICFSVFLFLCYPGASSFSTYSLLEELRFYAYFLLGDYIFFI